MFKSATYEDALDVFENALVSESKRLNAGIKKPVIFQAQIKKLLTLDQSTYEPFSRETRQNVVLGFKDFLPKTPKRSDASASMMRLST